MRLVLPALLLLCSPRLCAGMMDFQDKGILLTRQDDGSNCSTLDTCSQCFGPGYVICTYISCFNPSIYQQCCGDGTYCVAANNSCCAEAGPGVTGKDGIVAATLPPGYPAPPQETSFFTCNRTQTNEECCQGGGPNLHWCSGDFPDTACYESTAGQFCCTNGVVCDGEGCCKLIGATPTTPWTSKVPATTKAPVTTAKTNSTSATSGGSTVAPTKTGQSTTSVSVGTSQSINIAPTGVSGGRIAVGCAIAAGLIGLAL